ncbi:aromatic amino acid aminotransferase [Actibacterium sp. EMB200-NS6]|uniref:Aromatic-amino-acid transaminase n=1 Tax=Actibacterium naphthalenivorans TaxID=1614693 RepID=A0A840CF07_9RHOB|nr:MULTISPECIES: amino acid aminotransferase [Actibacterium]ALG89088.1 aromatic amino acid aminotransferase [Actibacterium sp. EMB200-NS6]MBB4021346.1 aromatic-amino-acid transaminase [Actibacterium naphthalenivorans]
MSRILSHLHPQPEDQILKLTALFRDDPRPVKLDLGVGVYRNAAGQTPVMRAVKAAEKQLWQDETSKSYTSLAGDPGFHKVMRDLVLGDAVDHTRVAAAATVGGTGALSIALDLVKRAAPGATVWVSDPTWPNHVPIIGKCGLASNVYRYFDAENRAVNFSAMMEDLARVAPGDVVLLHGCCHNPTGANLTLPEWQEVARLLTQTGALPLIDLAYQGFGDGLEEDAAATRLVAAACPDTLIAASCSKNFGIYRERTGIVLAVTPDAAAQGVVQGNLAALNRLTYSFPPDHGARLVTMVLESPALRADWQAELEDIRTSMLGLRRQLADELRARTGSDRFGFLAQHRGMFSRLGAKPEQVARLRDEHGIYMVGDSRMNIAGLSPATVPALATAIAACGI